MLVSLYIFSSISGGLKIKASLSGRGSKERTAKVYILHNTREPKFAPTQCCGAGKNRNEKTRKETFKKGEQEIGGTRKKTQETKEKRGKD